MIKVSVLYPNSGGAKFDIDYYCNKHMPMVRDKLGETCKGIAVEKGIAGGAPGAAWPFIAMGHLFFESVEDFHKAFDPNAKSIMADLPNFTNVQPAVQVSDVMINARRSETGELRLHKSDLG
jgi:uncharacterized protein (TIGR02118 family)